jgi:NDP-sugar pyrophosphorylase family protein
MKKINVLIPMAGEGQRFKEAGFDKPKPFIQINGRKMVEMVIDNITPVNVNEVILITRTHHNCKEELNISPYKLNIIELDAPTEGSLQTILHAESFIKDNELVLANCDQKIVFDVNDFILKCKQFDGGLITFTSTNPHHSYVQINNEGIITDIIEKEVISNIAVAGIYYFKDASSFIEASKEVIKSNIRQKGEFYVSSALKLMINNGFKLSIYDAPSIMLGTPEELKNNIHLI